MLSFSNGHEASLVMMSYVFELLIDAFKIPLKYPANDRHRHESGEDRDQVRIFPGNTETHAALICRRQRLRLKALDSKFEGLTMAGTEWVTNRGTRRENL
jgi:hypothetical protein